MAKHSMQIFICVFLNSSELKVIGESIWTKLGKKFLFTKINI